MNNALSFDIEDWFQVENLKPAIPREQWDKMELRVEASTRRILAALRESGAHATFFILGWVAERCPDLVRDIDRDGHEIASHGYGHELVYNMTPAAFREDLLRSKQILEGIVKKPVVGYRAPSFSITPENLWALDVLKEVGFEYDSSIFPVSLHDRYGFSGSSTRPFVWPNGLIEIPLSVYRIGRYNLPAAGGGYFRLFPYGYFHRIFTSLNRQNQPFTFYMHPWELDAGQPRVRVPWFYRFRHYVNLHNTEKRLRRLLKDFRFTSIPTAHRLHALKGSRSSMQRTRVVFIIDRIRSNLAGTENQLIKIINGLDPDRFELHLVCFGDHPWFQENRSLFKCQTHLVEVDRFKHPRTYINFFRLVKLLRTLRPDVVHTFFPVGNIVGVLAARLAGVTRVVSSRRDYGEWMRKDYLLVTKFANRFVDRIVTNSHCVKLLTQRMEKVDPDRIDVFYNGIDLSAFSGLYRDEDLKRELGIPKENKVVGIVANFRPMKRHETFVRAAKKILQQRDDVDFVLVGQDDGTAGRKQMIDAMTETLGIRKRFHFVGARQDVIRYLSIMDIGVNCSEAEGLSNAVMEYMAANVPCVVSDSGGNPDLITADINGVIFKLDDHDTLADEVLRLLADPLRSARYVASGRKRMETEMSLPAMLAIHDRFYRGLAGIVEPLPNALNDMPPSHSGAQSRL